ncbi:DEAD/DEAH box helicase domain protein [Pyrolobus fumarii 1A]|uniref:DEAD/DEAH box helicase domain protein n=1 Tax=Pyrolobus fumarii (strain DSM 11204 / 1A) TaxID=694429 RepID=G0EFL9_PYRF1|nr:hypothetical protein [Pyrolobus fumarii]AEM38190.1 DEAD/DEAH box helicase domain protein [Pyrolobus fumarii 1A]
MRFEEYIRRTAPLSVRDYLRYWERYRSIIESLGLERLPCNRWILKLASKSLSWAAAEGMISLEEETRTRRAPCAPAPLVQEDSRGREG